MGHHQDGEGDGELEGEHAIIPNIDTFEDAQIGVDVDEHLKDWPEDTYHRVDAVEVGE